MLLTSYLGNEDKCIALFLHFCVDLKTWQFLFKVPRQKRGTHCSRLYILFGHRKEVSANGITSLARRSTRSLGGIDCRVGQLIQSGFFPQRRGRLRGGVRKVVTTEAINSRTWPNRTRTVEQLWAFWETARINIKMWVYLVIRRWGYAPGSLLWFNSDALWFFYRNQLDAIRVLGLKPGCTYVFDRDAPVIREPFWWTFSKNMKHSLVGSIPLERLMRTYEVSSLVLAKMEFHIERSYWCWKGLFFGQHFNWGGCA